MRAFFVVPVVLLALSAPSPPPRAITASQALRAIEAHSIGQVKRTARGRYSALYTCSATGEDRAGLAQIDEAYRWRCALQVKGPRFPQPCTAEAYVSYVSAASKPNVLRVDWLAIGRSCGLAGS
jgi:hypothetical protein